MKRYDIHSPLIRQRIQNVFSQNKTPYAKHTEWHDLYRLAQKTNEITGLRIYEAVDPNMKALCHPIFIDGFSDPFFSEREWAMQKVKKEILFNHRPHLTMEDLNELYSLPIKIDSLYAVRNIFLRILKRRESYQKIWSMVSGPISSGGAGDRAKNLESFHQHIIDETEKGHMVFNQMPFEDFFGKVHEELPEEFTEDQNPIMDIVYRNVLRSGLIGRLKMKKDWKTSNGATTEHLIAKTQPIKIVEEKENVKEKMTA